MEDTQCFAKILTEQDKMKEHKIILQITNGTPLVGKTALRQITYKAHKFSAGPLFDRILLLLVERTLENQEHNLLVKFSNCIVQTQ